MVCLVGVELPTTHTHLVLKLDYVAEQVSRLIGSEACHEKKQALNGLPPRWGRENPTGEAAD